MGLYAQTHARLECPLDLSASALAVRVRPAYSRDWRLRLTAVGRVSIVPTGLSSYHVCTLCTNMMLFCVLLSCGFLGVAALDCPKLLGYFEPSLAPECSYTTSVFGAHVLEIGCSEHVPPIRFAVAAQCKGPCRVLMRGFWQGGSAASTGRNCGQLWLLKPFACPDCASPCTPIQSAFCRAAKQLVQQQDSSETNVPSSQPAVVAYKGHAAQREWASSVNCLQTKHMAWAASR